MSLFEPEHSYGQNCFPGWLAVYLQKYIIILNELKSALQNLHVKKKKNTSEFSSMSFEQVIRYHKLYVLTIPHHDGYVH